MKAQVSPLLAPMWAVKACGLPRLDQAVPQPALGAYMECPSDPQRHPLSFLYCVPNKTTTKDTHKGHDEINKKNTVSIIDHPSIGAPSLFPRPTRFLAHFLLHISPISSQASALRIHLANWSRSVSHPWQGRAHHTTPTAAYGSMSAQDESRKAPGEKAREKKNTARGGERERGRCQHE